MCTPGVKGLVSGRVLQVLHHVGHEAGLGETESIVQGFQLLLAVFGGDHHGVGAVLRLTKTSLRGGGGQGDRDKKARRARACKST